MAGETRRGETGAMGAPGSLRVLQATGHPIDAAPGLSGRRASRVDAAPRGVRRLPAGGGRGLPAGEDREAAARMLRLLHTADVHLGARHADLGDAAATQRERQFAAFVASGDLAIAERGDLFLVAGDLFDSNVQPRRSVERVGHELARLVEVRIRSILVPGTHDVYDRSSIYRAYDLPALAGSKETDPFVTVLTPDRPWVHIEQLDALVHGPCFPTKRAPHSPLRDISATEVPDATWKIGLLHAAVATPGLTDHVEVVTAPDEIAASALDYLALGHWHSTQTQKARGVTYAYSGAPEPVALDQDGAGKVLLVTLDKKGDKKQVTVEERLVGRTTFERREIDAATIESQAAFVA